MESEDKEKWVFESTPTFAPDSFAKQMFEPTGRQAPSQPNMQNLPIRTTEGRAIHQAFCGPIYMSFLPTPDDWDEDPKRDFEMATHLFHCWIHQRLRDHTELPRPNNGETTP